MSDSDDSFDLLINIQFHNFEPFARNVTYSINSEELAARRAEIVYLFEPYFGSIMAM